MGWRVAAAAILAAALVIPILLLLYAFYKALEPALDNCVYTPLYAECGRARIYYMLIVCVTVAGLFLATLMVLMLETVLHRLNTR